jgi:hypothetical protein
MKPISGGSTASMMGSFTPNITIKSLISLPMGPASRMPAKIPPTKGHPDAALAVSNPATAATIKTAKSQINIVTAVLGLRCQVSSRNLRSAAGSAALR